MTTIAFSTCYMLNVINFINSELYMLYVKNWFQSSSPVSADVEFHGINNLFSMNDAEERLRGDGLI